MANIEIQDGDDWIVVKVDGERISGDHSIHIDQLLTKLGHTVTRKFGEFGNLDEDGYSDGDDTVFTETE